jgi:hypothetical protein
VKLSIGNLLRDKVMTSFTVGFSPGFIDDIIKYTVNREEQHLLNGKTSQNPLLYIS